MNAAKARWLVWGAVLVAPFALIGTFDAQFGEFSTAGSSGIASAEMIVSSASQPPASEKPEWRDVALPLRYGGQRIPTSVWYRATVSIDIPTPDLWAVYVPQPNASLGIFVNGHFVGGGATERPLPITAAPLLLRFPGSLLRSGQNVIAIRSVRDSRWTTLAPFEVAPESILADRFQVRYFLEITLMRFVVACAVAMSLMMLLLFKMPSSDSVFGWYALALLFWAANIAIKLSPVPPVDVPHLWSNCRAIALGGYVISTMYFVHRLLRVKHPRIEKIALAWGSLGAFVLLADPLFLGYSLPWFFGRVWFPPILVLASFLTWQLIGAYRARRTLETRSFAALGWLLLVVGVRDNLLENQLIAGDMFYFPFTVGPTLIVFGLVLVQRFTVAVADVARARDSLELRVMEKTAELERNLTRLKDLERVQALAVERERIVRDMHDGVGGQLVQALTIASSRSELEAIKEPLQSCLDELRLIIDSIEPVDGNLASVLGTLRMRMSRRLREAGVRMIWQMEDIPTLTDFGPARVLQVSRIAQEAIANALKHARADCIIVHAYMSCAAEGRSVSIEIVDNGTGFSTPPGEGRGLRNMEKRAAEIGGSVVVESTSSGTCVTLSLPIEGAIKMPDVTRADETGSYADVTSAP